MLVLGSPLAPFHAVEGGGAVVLRGRVEEGAGSGAAAAAVVLRDRLLLHQAGGLMRVGRWSVAGSTKDVGHHLGRCDPNHGDAWGCIGHPICYSIGLSWNKRWLHGRYHAHRHRLRRDEGADWEGWC